MFVYSIKTRQQVTNNVKFIVRVLTRLASLLFTVRASVVATVSQKITVNSINRNLPLFS